MHSIALGGECFLPHHQLEIITIVVIVMFQARPPEEGKVASCIVLSPGHSSVVL